MARELALNRIPVHVVDLNDIASGATAYSSRLIHGGLRYLEYGEFRLVQESLAERQRLLKYAPHLVKPLRLHIPAHGRFGGFWSAVKRFFGLNAKGGRRGAWLIRIGLSLYDRYAGTSSLERHETLRSSQPQALPIDARKYPWQCIYSDGQVHYAERLVIAMLEDARRAAAKNRVEFAVTPYGDVTLQERILFVRYLRGSSRHEIGEELHPSVLVNATGAWVDLTLSQLERPEKEPLMGGTAGTHIVTGHSELRKRLAGRGIYAEASDGRPFFVLPFGDLTLIGTTDLPYAGDPRKARATPAELTYLVDSTRQLFNGLEFTADDIAWHYCGVRPLPNSQGRSTGAITRDHKIVEHTGTSLPMLSLVGGKLTTARALADQAADKIISLLNVRRIESSVDRPYPGGSRLAEGDVNVAGEKSALAKERGLSRESIDAIWDLYGDESGSVLDECAQRWPDNWQLIPGTVLPECLARYAIDHEWVHTIDDVISRRLMLLFHERLELKTVVRLAEILAEEGCHSEEQVSAQVTACRNALADRYGITLA